MLVVFSGFNCGYVSACDYPCDWCYLHVLVSVLFFVPEFSLFFFYFSSLWTFVTILVFLSSDCFRLSLTLSFSACDFFRVFVVSVDDCFFFFSYCGCLLSLISLTVIVRCCYCFCLLLSLVFIVSVVIVFCCFCFYLWLSIAVIVSCCSCCFCVLVIVYSCYSFYIWLSLATIVSILIVSIFYFLYL